MIETSLDARGVLTLTMNDPERRNALSADMMIGLRDGLARAREDDVRVAVLTNAGSVFCAGADLSERSRGTPLPFDPADIFTWIRELPKPVVARIAGHAVAGGLGLAAVADLSVAVETVTMGFTEVRIGVAPAIIATVCLPKMRRAAAADAMLRGHRFTAAVGAELGLVNEAVPAEELDDRVELIVADLLEGGPAALGAVKDLFRTLPTLGFSEALAWTGELSNSLFGGPEGAEGMRAYLEKRPAAWSPRAGGSLA